MAEDKIVARVVFDTSGLKNIGSAAGPMGSTGGAGGGGGGGALGGMALGKAGAIAGVVAAGVMEVIAQLKKVWNAVRESSPRLQATLGIMGKAFMMILRPIGDIIAMFLKPMAIYLLRFARNWYSSFKKWFEDLQVGPEKRATAPQAAIAEAAKKVVTGPTREAIDATQKATEAVQKSSTSFGGLNNTMNSGVSVLAILKGAWEIVWGTIGAVTGVVVLFGRGLLWLIEEILTPFQPLLTYLGQQFLAAGQFMEDLATAIVGLSLTMDWDQFKKDMSAAWSDFLTNNLVSIENLKTNFIDMFAKLGIDLPTVWAAVSAFFTVTVPGWLINGWDALKTFFTVTIPGWWNDMIGKLKSAADAITAPVRKAGSSIMNFFTGSSGASSTSTKPKGGSAGGGVIPSDTPWMVGEKGPEMISSGRPTSVTPMRGGQNVSISININALDASNINKALIDKLTTQLAYAMRYQLTRRTTESIGA